MRASLLSTGAALAIAALAACLPGSGPPLKLYQDDAGTPPPTDLHGDDAGAQRQDVDLGEPFRVTGLLPSHGPWTGGTRAIVRGRGFSSKLRVWIGGSEIDPSAIFASDPTRAAVIAPPGRPGPADVRIRDDASATESTLPSGFSYDAYVVEPSTGATSGGTRVALQGQGTAFGPATAVAIDGKPCDQVTATDATHLSCTTPPGAPGARDVVVTNPDGSTLQARDAFTYRDSSDGYRGGLSGGALNGSLKVLVFDAWVGKPIQLATVIAGGSLATALVKRTDSGGIATLGDPSLRGKVTVTIAAKCHNPTTFVDVPVDTVTVYIAPTLDPGCADGDPPSTGNYGGKDAGYIEGELVFPGGIEFKRSEWINVPVPVRPTERRAAYVFPATSSPTDTFQLPAAAAATTTDSAGRLGYAYSVGSSPGNITLYALAGIEDRSATPARFTAYAMGVARGVPVLPSTKTTGVDIPMTALLDHQVTLTPLPPPPAPRGPDRYLSILAVALGANAYATLPTGTTTTPLPLGGNVAMVAVPALEGALAGSNYTLTGAAVTGQYWQFPASLVTRLTTTDSNGALTIGGFLTIPTLLDPNAGAWGGTAIRVGGAGTADLIRLDIQSGGGLVTWTIVAPGGTSSFQLPDLGALPGSVGLVRGAISTMAYVARVSGAFDYGQLRYGQLGTNGWSAYAGDSVSGSY